MDPDSLDPPRYTIDLSRPPRERYKTIAADFKERLQALPVLFDEIVAETRLPLVPTHKLAKLLLRRLRSVEETEELRGIADVTGIQLYLLVVFNNLLDVLLGCTSAGVRIKDQDDHAPKMIHLRTLDWGMPALRSTICRLDFVESHNGTVICRTVTYVGYIGVLTGVKKDLSISLNFRPCHDSSTRMASLRFHLHQMLVLFGFRQSISSLLRQCLMRPISQQEPSLDGTLVPIIQHLSTTCTTAAYVIVCDGNNPYIIEKDHAHAAITSSGDFIVATNHDAAEEKPVNHSTTSANTDATALQLSGMNALVEESIDRKKKICALWEETTRRQQQRRSRAKPAQRRYVRNQDVVGFLRTYPILNEETHFAAVMDPQLGDFTFLERHLEPVSWEGD